MNGTDFLTGSRRIRKLYEARISRVCGRYGLTQIETDILAFLSNHPGKDKAGDIVRLRMLQKGNVSQAVEDLLGRGYLEKSQDQKDRRKLHLHLAGKSEEVIQAITQVRAEYLRELFVDFSPEEVGQFNALFQRIFENAAIALERKE